MTDQLSLRQRMLGDDTATSCLRTRRQLQRFLDADTDRATAARIARHLAACRPCGLEAETYRQIKATLRSRAAAAPADALARLVRLVTSVSRRAD